MAQKDKKMQSLKWERFIYVWILCFSLFLCGYYLALKDISFILLILIAFIAGIKVDKINNKLIDGDY